jgi:hypothetical protein
LCEHGRDPIAQCELNGSRGFHGIKGSEITKRRAAFFGGSTTASCDEQFTFG